MRPLSGPIVWKVGGTDGLALAVAPAAGSPSVSAVIEHRFAKRAFVDGLIVLPRPHAVLTIDQQMAAVAFSMVDEREAPFVSDLRGTLRGTNNAPAAMPLQALSGLGQFQFFKLQRFVRGNDIWRFSFQNENTAQIISLAGAFLVFREVPR